MTHTHPSVARYDGHADWYDSWSDGLSDASAALAELVPAGEGLAVEIGCGTGRNARLLEARGYRTVGVDVSGDQLRVARSRLPVVRGSGMRLPFADGIARLVVAVLVSTDVDRYDQVMAEAMRVVAPGGCVVHLGVHPCFRSPYAQTLDEGVLVHDGYDRVGWAPPMPWTGAGVSARVGVHHLPLADLLTAVLHGAGTVERVVERGDHGGLPWLLGMRLRR